MSAQAFQWFFILSLTVCTFINADSGQSIPFNQLGTEAPKWSGNKEIAVTELWNGYRLECRMQDLQAEVTMSGAILRSTSESEGAGVFSIRAARIGREKAMKEIPLKIDLVNASDDVVRAQRGNVVEEYTTSRDGIRQDFVITHRPGGRGNLVLKLAVEGADPVVTGDAIKVTLASGRELAYHALNVTDAKGKVLWAKFEKAEKHSVKVAIKDKGATYPIRIDPTISDADWVSMGGMPGVGGHVYALAFDERGNLYAGGFFNLAGGVIVNNIAKWNGSSWSALGNGANDGISDIVLDGSGNLYIAGWFDTAGGIAANHVARWNGNAWSALGSGMASADFLHHVEELALDGSGNLYAGGRFDTAGGTAVKNVAKWDGKAWNALGSGVVGDGPLHDVRALVSDGAGNLYVGGGFDTAGGIAVNHIAKWDGKAWSALGSGTDSMVLAVAEDSLGNLYAGGWFTKAGDSAAHHIAKWDGKAWSALGSGVDYMEKFGVEKFCLSIDNIGNLYAGGNFNSSSGFTEGHIAKWNGETWKALPLGSGIYEVFTLETDGLGSVYVGGYSRISKWDGGAWSTFGRYGTNSYILALAGDRSGNMYAGGSFTAIGNDGIAVKGIAKWDGSQWSALDSGANAGSYPYVRALVSDGSGNLYASGYLSDHPVARWDGTAWSPLGSDMSGDIYCLAADDSGNLYAGGRFETVGGITVNNIAKWDGSVWHALGSGIDDSASYPYVYALAIGGSGNLYAAGSFDTAGGVPARNIAKWDGKAWSALGNGVKAKGDIPVLALAPGKADTLYAGGYFDTAGGIAANNIAKWDGSKWSALGSGIDHPVDLDGQTGVFALSFDNYGNLYAGGGFDTAGGIPAHCIARWDGSQWSALGSGVSGGNVAGMYQSCIFALAVDNTGNLYTGGEFLSAGGKVSPNVAMCRLNGSTVQPRRTVNSSLHPLAYDSRSSIIRLSMQSATNVSYRLFSLAGREMHRDAAFLPKGTNSLRINTASLANGPYIAQVNAGKESMRFRMTVRR